MNKQKSLKNSAQINDVLLNIFPTQKKFLSIPFYDKHRGKSPNLPNFHSHAHTEIFACKTNSIIIKTPQEEYILEAGDVAIIPLGLVHTKLKNTDTKTEWCSAGLTCTRCKTDSESHLFPSVSALLFAEKIHVFKNQPKLFDLLVKVVNDSNGETVSFSELELTVEICRLAKSASGTVSQNTPKQKIRKIDIDRILKIEGVINNKYMFNISNKQLADELFLSERQLSRIVNRHYGMPLHTLFINRRIKAAANMLISSDDSVDNIAMAVGFNVKSGFYREFSRFYGQTPLQFRKANRNK